MDEKWWLGKRSYSASSVLDVVLSHEIQKLDVRPKLLDEC